MDKTLLEALEIEVTGFSACIDEVSIENKHHLAMSFHSYPHFLRVSELKAIRKLIDKTLDFYEINWITEDVVKSLNKTLSNELSAHLTSLSNEQTELCRHKKTKPVKIYIIRSQKNNALKIGMSIEPVKRLHSLQTSHSDELSLVASFDGRKNDEKTLHRTLTEQGYHLRGEWFQDKEEVINIVTKYFSKDARPLDKNT